MNPSATSCRYSKEKLPASAREEITFICSHVLQFQFIIHLFVWEGKGNMHNKHINVISTKYNWACNTHVVVINSAQY